MALTVCDYAASEGTTVFLLVLTFPAVPPNADNLGFLFVY
jgi:hypothetical protein